MQLKALKQAQFGQLGQIETLKRNLAKESTEKQKLALEKIKDAEDHNKQQTEKEKKMEQSLDILKTQLKFKEQENFGDAGDIQKIEKTNWFCGWEESSSFSGQQPEAYKVEGGDFISISPWS